MVAVVGQQTETAAGCHRSLFVGGVVAPPTELPVPMPTEGPW